MDRRTFITTTALLAVTGLAPARIARAQGSYPSGPIKIVVPFPPGGAVDATIRILEPKLREILGQPVIIENKPGASGSVGAAQVAKATADGYTLLFAPREVFGINPLLNAAAGYDALEDLSPIGIATEGPYVLVANPSVGAKTVAELVAAAKAKSLAYASFGAGSMGHLNLEAFARHTGVELLHVPFRGAPAAVQAVVAGDVQLAISTPPSILGFVAEGKLTALAIGAKARSELLPTVPTLAEAGQPADLLVPAYFALAAPAGTDVAIVGRLGAALKSALADPSAADRLKKVGLLPVAGSPTDMTQTIKSDLARFGKLIKDVGIKVQ